MLVVKATISEVDVIGDTKVEDVKVESRCCWVDEYDSELLYHMLVIEPAIVEVGVNSVARVGDVKVDVGTS